MGNTQEMDDEKRPENKSEQKMRMPHSAT